MASAKGEAVRLLKGHGFKLLKTGKHETWGLNGQIVTVPRGSKFGFMLERSIRSQVRRVVEGLPLTRSV